MLLLDRPGRANDEERGAYGGEPLAFPGFGPGAAALLVERGAAGLGIDTLGVDAGAATDFPVHQIALPAGLWHLEGLIGLDAVPPTGATLVVGALRLPNASGTPARVLAAALSRKQSRQTSSSGAAARRARGRRVDEPCGRGARARRDRGDEPVEPVVDRLAAALDSPSV